MLGFGLYDGAAGGADPALRDTSGDTPMLSLALRRALGAEALTAHARRRLWDLLGRKDGAVRTLDRDGRLQEAWCGPATSARDPARLGRRWLHGGRGGAPGRPLLSARRIAESMPRVGPDGRRVHTHGWWPAVQEAGDTVIVQFGKAHGHATMAGRTALFDRLAEHDWRAGRQRDLPGPGAGTMRACAGCRVLRRQLPGCAGACRIPRARPADERTGQNATWD